MPKKTILKAEYRYFCIACTNVAFLSVGKTPKNHASNCEKCGFVVGELKEENFLPLEADHPANVPTATIYA